MSNIVVSPEPKDSPRAVFFNTYTGVGGGPDIWHTVDMSSYVSEACTAIHLSGILIITHGTTAETADLRLWLTNDTNTTKSYVGQTIEAAVGGGQRSNMACWVKLDANKKFYYKYKMTNPGTTWPTYSSYGANLSMDAYVEE